MDEDSQIMKPSLILTVLYITPTISLFTQSLNTFIPFSLGYWAPLVLSYKAITAYEGYDKPSRYWPVVLQRSIFIMLTQSLPLAFLLSLQLHLLVGWGCVVIAFGLFLRLNLHFIRSTQSTTAASPPLMDEPLSLLSASSAPNTSDTNPIVEPSVSIKCAPTLAFYHPHAHQRAGGEMVLWRLLHNISSQNSFLEMFHSQNSLVGEDYQPHITLFSSVPPKNLADNAFKSVNTLSDEVAKHQPEIDDQPPSTGTAQFPSNIYSVIETLNDDAETYIQQHIIQNERNASRKADESASSPPLHVPAQCDKTPKEQVLHFVSQFILHETARTFGFSFSHLQLIGFQTALRKWTLSLNSPFVKRLRLDRNQQCCAKLPDDSPQTTQQISDESQHQDENKPEVAFSIVYLEHTAMGDSANYPRLTLVLQTFNAIFPFLWYIMCVIIQYYVILSLPYRENQSSQLPAETEQLDNSSDNTAPSTTLAATAALPVPPITDHSRKRKQEYQIHLPFLVIDTAGYPILSLLCAICGIPAASYTHYPIISSDMVDRNLHQISTLYSPETTDQPVSPAAQPLKQWARQFLSDVKRYLKHYYFCALFYIYAWLLTLNEFIFANGSWTYGHLRNLLTRYNPQTLYDDPVSAQPVAPTTTSSSTPQQQSYTALNVLFPPCNIPSPPLVEVNPDEDESDSSEGSSERSETPQTSKVTKSNLNIHARAPLFIMLGQYRPEKQQMLILHAFKEALQRSQRFDVNGDPIMLLFVGTLRPDDYPLVQQLQDYINRTTIERYDSPDSPPSTQDATRKDNVTASPSQSKSVPLKNHVRCLFNVPLTHLQHLLKHALCGVHAMVDEHFGIGVVELMASCPFTIAHNSAGPGRDIIVPAIVYKDGVQQTNDANKAHAPQSSHEIPKHTSVVGAVATEKKDYVQAIIDTINLFEQDIERLDQHYVNEYVQIDPNMADVDSTSKHSSIDLSHASTDTSMLSSMSVDDDDITDFVQCPSRASTLSTTTTLPFGGQPTSVFETIHTNALLRASSLFSIKVFDSNIQSKLLPMIQNVFNQQIGRWSPSETASATKAKND